jgi:hypothetical protein
MATLEHLAVVVAVVTCCCLCPFPVDLLYSALVHIVGGRANFVVSAMVMSSVLLSSIPSLVSQMLVHLDQPLLLDSSLLFLD